MIEEHYFKTIYSFSFFINYKAFVSHLHSFKDVIDFLMHIPGLNLISEHIHHDGPTSITG